MSHRRKKTRHGQRAPPAESPDKRGGQQEEKRDMQIFSIRGEKQSRKKNIGKNPERK